METMALLMLLPAMLGPKSQQPRVPDITVSTKHRWQSAFQELGSSAPPFQSSDPSLARLHMTVHISDSWDGQTHNSQVCEKAEPDSKKLGPLGKEDSGDFQSRMGRGPLGTRTVRISCGFSVASQFYTRNSQERHGFL